MALFGSKKKTTSTTKTSEKKIVAAKPVSAGSTAYPHVLKRPHITEKAAVSAEKGVYVFEVAASANKRQVAEAVAAFYKVTPVKVAVMNKPQKSVFVKGRPGVRPGGKKAYVYLKKGDKIELV